MRFSIQLRKLIIASNHPPLIALIREVLKHEYTKDYWSIALDDDKLSYAKEVPATGNPYEGRRVAKKITGALTELHAMVKDIIPMTPRDLEVCGDKLKAAILKVQYSFIIVGPSEFKKYYHVSNYTEDTTADSTLHKSCMRGDEEQAYLKFYSYFPCKLLVMLNRANKVVGRAILWTLSAKQGMQLGHKNVTYYDRIYYTTTVTLAMIEQYCSDNDFVFLDKDRANYSINAIIPNDTKFPYLDSFRYGFIRPYSDKMYIEIATAPRSENNLKPGDSLVQLTRTNGALEYQKCSCAACGDVTTDIYTIDNRGYHSYCVISYQGQWIPRGAMIKDADGNYTLIKQLQLKETND